MKAIPLDPAPTLNDCDDRHPIVETLFRARVADIYTSSVGRGKYLNGLAADRYRRDALALLRVDDGDIGVDSRRHIDATAVRREADLRRRPVDQNGRQFLGRRLCGELLVGTVLNLPVPSSVTLMDLPRSSAVYALPISAPEGDDAAERLWPSASGLAQTAKAKTERDLIAPRLNKRFARKVIEVDISSWKGS
jgi:hypothetical protein